MFRPITSQPADLDALHEGIPPWVEQPLHVWMKDQLRNGADWGYLTGGTALVQQFDRLTRQTAPFAHDYAAGGLDQVIRFRNGNDILELLNFMVWSIATHHRANTVQWRLQLSALEVMLKEAGSTWTVSTRSDVEGLERRVPEAVSTAAEVAMTVPNAGIALSRAWSHAFGRSPDPSRAYGDAIRAVEEAAIPVVQPKHAKATLGTVIGQMKSDGDWALPIEHPNKLMVTQMCEQLWGGQTDRHGANQSHAPSQQAAESAVLLAVPLVQWFSAGAVSRF